MAAFQKNSTSLNSAAMEIEACCDASGTFFHCHAPTPAPYLQNSLFSQPTLFNVHAPTFTLGALEHQTSYHKNAALQRLRTLYNIFASTFTPGAIEHSTHRKLSVLARSFQPEWLSHCTNDQQFRREVTHINMAEERTLGLIQHGLTKGLQSFDKSTGKLEICYRVGITTIDTGKFSSRLGMFCTNAEDLPDVPVLDDVVPYKRVDALNVGTKPSPLHRLVLCPYVQKYRAFRNAEEGLQPQLDYWVEKDVPPKTEAVAKVEAWRQKMQFIEQNDALGPPLENWSDEAEAEEVEEKPAQELGVVQANDQDTCSKAAKATAPISDMDRQLAELDRASGFRAISGDWADDVEEDEDLPDKDAQHTIPQEAVSPAPVSIFTLRLQECDARSGYRAPARRWSDDEDEEDDLPAHPTTAGTQEATNTNFDAPLAAERPSSVSSDESHNTVDTPPTSPEIDADDDIDSIYADAENDGQQQPPCSRALVLSGSTYVDDMDLEEEYELQHGRPLPTSDVASNANRLNTELDDIEASMTSPIASTTSLQVCTSMAIFQPAVQIPGLGLIEDIDQDQEAILYNSVEPPEIQELDTTAPSTALTTGPQRGQLIVQWSLEPSASVMPGPHPIRSMPITHLFENGAMAMTAPGQSLGLVRSPAMYFDQQAPARAITFTTAPDTIHEEEDVVGTLLNDNVITTRGSDLDSIVTSDIIPESAVEEASTSPSESDLTSLTLETSNMVPKPPPRQDRQVHFDLPPLVRALSTATTASSGSSMATLYQCESPRPSSTTQLLGLHSRHRPAIPPRSSSLPKDPEPIINFEHDAGVPSRQRLPIFRRTREDWRHASWSSVVDKLKKKGSSKTTTTAPATGSVAIRNSIMMHASSNKSQFFKSPEGSETTRVSDACKIEIKKKNIFKKGVGKITGFLAKKKNIFKKGVGKITGFLAKKKN